VKQYESYEPLPGRKIQGKLTLRENIADVAGLQVAYDAYKLSPGGNAAPVIDGFTGDQRFFLGWAQSWCRNYREANLIQPSSLSRGMPCFSRPSSESASGDYVVSDTGFRGNSSEPITAAPTSPPITPSDHSIGNLPPKASLSHAIFSPTKTSTRASAYLSR
jgi:hypothetical protein